jgi:hypothetical protein
MHQLGSDAEGSIHFRKFISSSTHLYIFLYEKGIVLNRFESITDCYVPTLLEKILLVKLMKYYYAMKFKTGCLLLFQGKSCWLN